MPEVIFHHVCIQTNTYEESLRFYCDLLDMKIVKETAGFHGRAYNTWLQKDRFAIELQTPKGDQTFDPDQQRPRRACASVLLGGKRGDGVPCAASKEYYGFSFCIMDRLCIRSTAASCLR